MKVTEQAHAPIILIRYEAHSESELNLNLNLKLASDHHGMIMQHLGQKTSRLVVYW